MLGQVLRDCFEVDYFPKCRLTNKESFSSVGAIVRFRISSFIQANPNINIRVDRSSHVSLAVADKMVVAPITV
jgi:hypothetical protein